MHPKNNSPEDKILQMKVSQIWYTGSKSHRDFDAVR